LRHPGLRQLCPAYAGEASGQGADGLQDLLPRAAGSPLRGPQRLPLLLKVAADATGKAKRRLRLFLFRDAARAWVRGKKKGEAGASPFRCAAGRVAYCPAIIRRICPSQYAIIVPVA